MVICRVWNNPINPGWLFGQLIGIAFKDILDTWYEFSYKSVRMVILFIRFAVTITICILQG